MSSRKLLDAFDGIDASMILEAEPKGKEDVVMTRKRKPLKSLIFVAAAVLTVAVLSVTVVAVTVANNEMAPYWSTVFVRDEKEGEETEASENLEQLNKISFVPENIVYNESDPNVSLRIVGVTAGTSHAYIWYEVELSDELMAKIDGRPEKVAALMDFEIYEKGETYLPFYETRTYHSGSYLGTKAELMENHMVFSETAKEDTLTQSPQYDNIFCFVYRFSTGLELPGQMMTMHVARIEYQVASAEDPTATEWVPLIEGTWEVTFSLDVPRIGDTYYQYGCTVELSPVFIRISRNYDPATGDEKMVTHPRITLVKADGTGEEVEFSSMSRSVSFGPGGRLTVGGSVFFDTPIDSSQVVAVIYGGITISISEETLVKPETAATE